jgi:hypothetical protein
MRLRSSSGYDANDVAPQRVCNEQHSGIDKTDSIEAQLAIVIDVVELDHIGGQSRK